MSTIRSLFIIFTHFKKVDNPELLGKFKNYVNFFNARYTYKENLVSLVGILSLKKHIYQITWIEVEKTKKI